MQLIFATNNKNKIEEVRSALSAGLDIVTLKEAGIDIEIPEPHETIEENAAEKSSVIYHLTNRDCFGEDTGLEAEALAGAPGVRSARYAGDKADFKKNTALLLHNLKDVDNRQAKFKTVISLMIGGEEFQFTGICKGVIIEEERGTHGFGYDSVFIPAGDTRTFAEMTIDEKNKYSHRKKALTQLIEFLNDRYGKN